MIKERVIIKTNNQDYYTLEKILADNSKVIFANIPEITRQINKIAPNAYMLNDESEANISVIESLYNCYEFSDKVIFISENTMFGGIQNLLQTGLLTLEETVEAILFKK